VFNTPETILESDEYSFSQESDHFCSSKVPCSATSFANGHLIYISDKAMDIMLTSYFNLNHAHRQQSRYLITHTSAGISCETTSTSPFAEEQPADPSPKMARFDLPYKSNHTILSRINFSLTGAFNPFHDHLNAQACVHLLRNSGYGSTGTHPTRAASLKRTAKLAKPPNRVILAGPTG